MTLRNILYINTLQKHSFYVAITMIFRLFYIINTVSLVISKIREVSVYKPSKQTFIMEDIQEKYNHLLQQNEALRQENEELESLLHAHGIEYKPKHAEEDNVIKVVNKRSVANVSAGVSGATVSIGATSVLPAILLDTKT